MSAPASILITGGTGFFGKALLRRWQLNEASRITFPRVVVLTRDSKAFLRRYPEFSGLPWLEFHTGDILIPSSLPACDRFTHILHAAADSSLGPLLTPLERFQQIVDGTRNLLEFAVTVGAHRFLLTSTGGIYGPQLPEVTALLEDWPGSPALGNPANAYSIGKRAAEHLCILYQDAFGIEVVIARCFAFVGPDLPLDLHFAIGNFIRDALHREAIEVTSDGSPLRTYLDQNDLADWLLALLARGRPGNAYNVGSDEVISIAALAHLVRDLVAPGKPVHILGQAREVHDRNRYIPDIRKAQRELGLAVTIPLAEAILRTSAAHRGQRLP